MVNPRVRKVADRIQVIVAEMLERRVKDPRLGFVTITDVRVSGDTQQASVFYTVLGEDEEVAGSAAALESAKGLIRSEVGKQLGTRHVPTLEFLHDALPETARHLVREAAHRRRPDAHDPERPVRREHSTKNARLNNRSYWRLLQMNDEVLEGGSASKRPEHVGAVFITKRYR